MASVVMLSCCISYTEVNNWTEEVTPDGIRYGHREVTLHPVAGGNVRLASFSGEEFDAIR